MRLRWFGQVQRRDGDYAGQRRWRWSCQAGGLRAGVTEEEAGGEGEMETDDSLMGAAERRAGSQ